MIRFGRPIGWLLLAAASAAAAAQEPPGEAPREFYVEVAPDATPDIIAQARLMAGIGEAREITGSRVQLWRVSAGRVSEALNRARRARGIRAVDVTGPDFRSLFVGVENQALLTEAQLRALDTTKADARFDETLVARLRADALGLLPLLTGFGEREGLPVSGSFVLELEPGFQVVATRRSLRPGPIVTRWSGALLDPATQVPVGVASFVVEGRNILGSISTARGNFSVRPLGDGVHAISRVGFPAASDSDRPGKPRPLAAAAGIRRAELANALAAPQSAMATGATAAVNGRANAASLTEEAPGGAVIRIAVAYTAAAAKQLSLQGAIRPTSRIENAVEEANLSFVASGIRVTLKLVDTQPALDPEDGTAEADLAALLDRKDRRYDELPRWRRDLAANAVILIVADSNRCGLAPERIPVTAAEAYAVVRQDCLDDVILPHELGHLLGARHDDDEDDNDHRIPYGRGYVSPDKFQTIMGNSTMMTHAAIWAGPDIRLRGIITGTAERHHDARVINERARAFSRFREE